MSDKEAGACFVFSAGMLLVFGGGLALGYLLDSWQGLLAAGAAITLVTGLICVRAALN